MCVSRNLLGDEPRNPAVYYYNTCILDSLTHAYIQRTQTHTHTEYIHIYKKIVFRVDRTGFTRNLGKHDTHAHIY